MSKFRVFISHSAKDAIADDVLNKLYENLSQNFEVLLDRERLEPGVEWRLELFSWLERCHGAVILLSEDALESSWVLQESTILNWRRHYEKDFTLIPVLLPSVNQGRLETGWFSAIDLTRIQMVSGNNGDEIVKSIVKTVESSQSKLEETRRKIESFSRPDKNSESDEPVEQVAAICYEKRDDESLRFRLVNTRNKSGKERWIFPKGWTQQGEPLWLSALLEARQEAGVTGEVARHRFANFNFWKEENEKLRIAAFLLRVESTFSPREKGRNSSWFTPEEAKSKLALHRAKGRHAKNLVELQRVIDLAVEACPRR